MDFKVGFMVGFLLVLLTCFIFAIAQKKAKEGKSDYDERQQMVRGKGYKAGFFTMLICNMFIACLSNDDGVMNYINTDAAVWISAFLSITVFAVYCIVKDGYFGIVENPKSTVILLLVIGIINIVIGISNYNNWVVDGKLSNGIINFACGVTLFAVSLAGVVKLMLNKREDE